MANLRSALIEVAKWDPNSINEKTIPSTVVDRIDPSHKKQAHSALEKAGFDVVSRTVKGNNGAPNDIEIVIKSEDKNDVKKAKDILKKSINEEELDEAKGLNWPSEVKSDFRDAIRNYEYASDIIDFLKSKQKAGSKEYKWIESNRDEIIDDALQYGLKEEELDDAHDDDVKKTPKRKGDKDKGEDEPAKPGSSVKTYSETISKVFGGRLITEKKDDKKKNKNPEPVKDKVDTDPELDDDSKVYAESLEERELSPEEEKKKEEYVKKLKSKESEFKKKYGDKWQDVMYGTATKMAKNNTSEEFHSQSKP